MCDSHAVPGCLWRDSAAIREASAKVARDGHVDADVLVELGAVDVDVDLPRIQARMFSGCQSPDRRTACRARARDRPPESHVLTQASPCMPIMPRFKG